MFTIVTIETATGPTVALASAGEPKRYVPIAAAGARLGIPIADVRLFDLLQTWDESWTAIAAIAEVAFSTGRLEELAIPLAAATPREVSSFRPARKVLCAGANYYRHLAEMNVTFVKDAGQAPFFFLKPPNALVGSGRTIPVDRTITMLDWEVELVVIIGRTGRDIPALRALDHVAGYSVAIDLTARDRLMQPESIFKFDFLAGKGQDGFCPTAHALLPARFLPDPQATRLRLAVNGQTKQDASTDDMIYSVAELVSWASKLTTLEPGDVLLTGSPEGVGFPRRQFLAIGDRVHAALDPLVTLDVELFERTS